jgi:hypothetical protein
VPDQQHLPLHGTRDTTCITADGGTAGPNWLGSDGWVRQDGSGSTEALETPPAHVQQTDGYQFDMRVYKKSFAAGTVSIKSQFNNQVPFYSIVVKAHSGRLGALRPHRHRRLGW